MTRALPPCAEAVRSLEYSAFSDDTCARRHYRRHLELNSNSARVRSRRESSRDEGGSLRVIYSANSRDDERNTAVSIDGSSH